MGGNTILKAVWLSFVISSGALLLNAAMDIEMLEFPAASKSLMVGEKLELRWKYDVEESARYQWKISLYVFNYTNNAKHKLLILQRPGNISARQSLPLVYRRLHLELSYNKARISIPTTTFDDTAAYGIMLEPSTWNNTAKPFQKVTDVTIVDMFVDEAESSTVLRTWIGQPVKFVCTITLKVGADSPSFSWKNVLKNVTITENIFATRTKSVLTINPQNEDDFGSYKCYARTIRTKIKHNVTLIKVDYPGYPILISFSPQKRSLTWMAPKLDEHGQRSSFIVQYLQNREKCSWVNVNTTSDLSISLYSLSEYLPEIIELNCSVRVCFHGRKKDSKNTSCSREHKVYSKISPRPNIHLTNDSSKKATLSWRRQNGDRVEILGYVIQMFHASKYGKAKPTSIHLDNKRQNGEYTFNNLETIKHVLLRVCIRNTLCIYEQSCSKKVGLRPVFPSEPRSIQIKFYNNLSYVKISWVEPRVTGKGSLLYIIEVQKEGKGKWKEANFTNDLYTDLISPSLSDHIRVCARNDVDLKRNSCSESYDLGKAKLKSFELGFNGSSCRGAKSLIIFVLIVVKNVLVPFH